LKEGEIREEGKNCGWLPERLCKREDQREGILVSSGRPLLPLLGGRGALSPGFAEFSSLWGKGDWTVLFS